MRYQELSLWHDNLTGDDLSPRAPLPGATSVDVAIVGAGFTGLWTAYYLKRLQPDISVAVIESEVAGFGASGRNGGWASGEFSMNVSKTIARHGRGAVLRLFRAAFDSIDEIGRVVAAEGIEADYQKGGTITFASTPAQEIRLKTELNRLMEFGFSADDYRWLDRSETASWARSPLARGALYTPHCAAIHPAKLARGLARTVEGMGVKVYERTPALALGPGRVETAHGVITASHVLQCTEAFSVGLPGGKRWVVPVYSLMVATEPLPSSTWEEIGLDRRPTFNDARHVVIYGQRTADGRFAFGGRGAPYHFRSAMRPDFEQDPPTHAGIARVLRRLFPAIGDAAITHTWGGAVAIPRDWTAAVVYDRANGFGRAGGYVGSGVTPSNLAGRTLADLVLDRDTDLVHHPWVGHRSRRWEPEPLRYLGVNLGRGLAPLADAVEERTGKPSKTLGGLLHLLTGH